MVKIAELKNNLSRHLAHVRQGGQITVLDRETPVARIIPFLPAEPRVGEEDAAAGTAAERIAELARQGLVSPGDPRAVADSLASRPPLRVPPGAPRALDVLLEMRRESRR